MRLFASIPTSIPAFILTLCACAGLALAQATVNPDAAKKPAVTIDITKPKEGPGKVGWWNDAVFYQIFVRSFQDNPRGAKSGDGIGDFQGLITRLDYLNDGDPKTDTDMGITAIWLMPVMQSPSYHGYDVQDYKQIEQDYGTNADFQKFVAEAHKRGIKVILDLVLNHTSDKHPWFTESAKPKSEQHDWYIWAEKDPAYKGPWNQKVWHKKGPGFYYGIFSDRMPDLNYANPLVTREMLDITKWGLTDMKVDGYRLDAIRHLFEDGQLQESAPQTFDWLKQYFAATKEATKDAFSIGEVWAPSDQASMYVGGMMDAVFEFDLAGAMVQAAREGKAQPVIDAQAKVLALYPPNQYGRFLSNHDQTRVMTQLRDNEASGQVAAVMLLTGPGIPFIYYGEELGMTGDKPDENLRTPMQWENSRTAGFTTGKPWRAVQPDIARKNLVTQRKDQDSMFNLYRKLIELRTQSEALRAGSYIPVESANPGVYAFIRPAGTADPRGRNATDAKLVVINLTDAPIADYTLSAQLRLGDPAVSTELLRNVPITQAKWSDAGTFVGWKPFAELEAKRGYIIDLKVK
jgi:glycosidase